MDDSMSETLLVGLRQKEWEHLMQFIASNYDLNYSEEDKGMNIIIQKLTNQIY